MARISTSRPEEDEEDLIEDVAEEEEEEEQVSAPAVSDRRRRRQLKRGEVVAEAEVTPQPSRSKERPTPSQRAETETKSTNSVVRFFQNILEYFREVQSELSKVTWLSREDALRLTYIVIIVTTVSALFLGLISYIFGLLTQALAGGSSILAGAVTIVLILAVAGAWLFRDSLFSRFE